MQRMQARSLACQSRAMLLWTLPHISDGAQSRCLFQALLWAAWHLCLKISVRVIIHAPWIWKSTVGCARVERDSERERERGGMGLSIKCHQDFFKRSHSYTHTLIHWTVRPLTILSKLNYFFSEIIVLLQRAVRHRAPVILLQALGFTACIPCARLDATQASTSA